MFREWLNNLRLRLRALAKRRQLHRDLEEEVAFHLAAREMRNRDVVVGLKLTQLDRNILTHLVR